jgi:peroxin-16
MLGTSSWESNRSSESIAPNKQRIHRMSLINSAPEMSRAALRLALLHLSGNRPSIQPPIPEREVDPAMLEEDRKAALQSMTQTNGESGAHGGGLQEENSAQEEVWRGTRTGFTRPTLSSIRSRSHPNANAALPESNGARRRHPLASSHGLGSSQGLLDGSSASNSDSDSDETLVDSWTEKDVNDYLLSRTLTPNDVRQPQDLVRALRGSMGYSAELLWILRPLLYGESSFGKKTADTCTNVIVLQFSQC